MRESIFKRVNTTALPVLEGLCREWLPDGRRMGAEWVARNPRRADRRAGSFKINLKSGRWADFATGDAGGDVISFYAYLTSRSQIDAARTLAGILGVTP